MAILQNPFTDSALVPAMAADAAAAPDLSDPPVAAAEPFHGSPSSKGGSRKRRRLLGRTQRPPRLPKVSPPIPFDPASADNRFELDDLAFMIEVMPRPFFMIGKVLA